MLPAFWIEIQWKQSFEWTMGYAHVTTSALVLHYRNHGLTHVLPIADYV